MQTLHRTQFTTPAHGWHWPTDTPQIQSASPGLLLTAPHLIVGLPIWRHEPAHPIQPTRYNVSRLYDPDGEIVSTHSKVHSAENRFMHGHQLNEFEVEGVSISMHICHDGR